MGPAYISHEKIGQIHKELTEETGLSSTKQLKEWKMKKRNTRNYFTAHTRNGRPGGTSRWQT